MTRSRSTTTASAEVRRIKRLLGAKKPLTPTQGGQLVMALKAAMNDPDAFATLDELTTLTVARFCSSAEQLDATAASALLATLLDHPALLLEGVTDLARAALLSAEDTELARRMCSEALKSLEITLRFAKAAASAFSFESGEGTSELGFDRLRAMLLGDDAAEVEAARATKLPIALEHRCHFTELALAVYESVGDEEWASKIVKNGVKEHLASPTRPIIRLYHLVKFVQEVMDDAALARKICQQAKRAAKTFQDRADLFLLLLYALKDSAQGKQAFDDCAQRAKAWQEHLWLAEFLTQNGTTNPMADRFFEASLTAARGERAATLLIAESIERFDPDRAEQVRDDHLRAFPQG
jgi:hypothetical protein